MDSPEAFYFSDLPYYVRADRNKAIGPQIEAAATYADESSSPIAVLLSREDIQW